MISKIVILILTLLISQSALAFNKEGWFFNFGLGVGTMTAESSEPSESSNPNEEFSSYVESVDIGYTFNNSFSIMGLERKYYYKYNNHDLYHQVGGIGVMYNVGGLYFYYGGGASYSTNVYTIDPSNAVTGTGYAAGIGWEVFDEVAIEICRSQSSVDTSDTTIDTPENQTDLSIAIKALFY